MKAIILAAGRGSRLGSMTDTRPKGMVEVGGKPLLEWQMDALRGAGINEITVVRGYQGRAIPFTEVRYRDNMRWDQTNMVGSLLAARDVLESDDCVVSYADIIYPAAVVQKLIAGHGDIRITYDTNWLNLWSRRFSDPLSDAETFQVDEQGCLLEIGQKPVCVDEVRGQYMGLLFFSRSGWKIISDTLDCIKDRVDRLDMTSLLQLLLKRDVSIEAVPITEKWLEIDSETDLGLFDSIWIDSGPDRPA